MHQYNKDMNDVYQYYDDTNYSPEEWENYSYNGDHGHTTTMADIERWMKIFLPPIFISLGTAANFICLVIFLSFALGKYPSGAILMILCLTDMVLLYSETGSKWDDSATTNSLLSTKSDTKCKLVAFITQLSKALNNWILIILLCESLYITLKPHKIINLRNLYVKDTLAILFVIGVVFNIHYFWTMGLTTVNVKLAGYGELKQKYCTLQFVGTQEPNHEHSKIWAFIFLVTTEAIPITATSVLLICITYTKKNIARVEDNMHICQKAIIKQITLQTDVDDRVELFYLNANTILQFNMNVYPTLAVVFLFCSVPNLILKTVDYYGKTTTTSKEAWTMVLTVVLQFKYIYHSGKITVYLICSTEVKQKLMQLARYFYGKIRKYLKNFMTKVCSRRSKAERLDMQRIVLMKMHQENHQNLEKQHQGTFV